MTCGPLPQRLVSATQHVTKSRSRGGGAKGKEGFQEEEGLFKANARREVDAGRDCATLAWVRHDADKPLTPKMVMSFIGFYRNKNKPKRHVNTYTTYITNQNYVEASKDPNPYKPRKHEQQRNIDKNKDTKHNRSSNKRRPRRVITTARVTATHTSHKQ